MNVFEFSKLKEGDIIHVPFAITNRKTDLSRLKALSKSTTKRSKASSIAEKYATLTKNDANSKREISYA